MKNFSIKNMLPFIDIITLFTPLEVLTKISTVKLRQIRNLTRVPMMYLTYGSSVYDIVMLFRKRIL